MPAEWEPHAATWIGWPHNRSDWPGKFEPIPWVYAEIVRALVPGEIVRILVNDAAHEARARRVLNRAGVSLSRVQFFRFPTNRGWTRDFGPLFVQRPPPGPITRKHRPETKNQKLETPSIAIARFRFNAWAKYSEWRKDDAVALRSARRLGVPIFPVRHRNRDVVLEGGSIDVNGRGALLTTEECLLHPRVQVRNPGFRRADYEGVFRAALGVTNVFWLGRGIAGDDTHGHVDDLCRFVGPKTIVLCSEKNPRDPNYRALAVNRECLSGMRLADGSRLDVVPLPMPPPVVFEGQRLPASYANFYIANAAVLVPTFNDPKDRVALGILAEHFRDRPVFGIHARDLVWGLGTIHCLTQQQPALDFRSGM